MNKKELIEAIAKKANISQKEAQEAVAAFVDTVKCELKKKDGTVQLVGFGTFCVAKRAARKGHNPKTGEPMKIKAAKLPKFKPGKALKDAVNK